MAKKKQEAEQLTLDLGAAAGYGEAHAAPTTHYVAALRLYTRERAEQRNIPSEGSGHGSYMTTYPPPGHRIAEFISKAIESGGEAAVEIVRVEY